MAVSILAKSSVICKDSWEQSAFDICLGSCVGLEKSFTAQQELGAGGAPMAIQSLLYFPTTLISQIGLFRERSQSRVSNQRFRGTPDSLHRPPAGSPSSLAFSGLYILTLTTPSPNPCMWLQPCSRHCSWDPTQEGTCHLPRFPPQTPEVLGKGERGRPQKPIQHFPCLWTLSRMRPGLCPASAT